LDGWIEAISWAPNGKECVVASHNSTINTIYWKDSRIYDKIETTKMTNFPLVSLVHKNDTELIGGGYDCLPMHYKKDGYQWKLEGWYEENSNGLKMQLTRKPVESNARQIEIRTQAKSRSKPTKWNPPHFTVISSMGVTQKEKNGNLKEFFSADSKGN